MAKAASPVPAGFYTMTPQLTLDKCAETIDWYKKAFGAEEISRGLGPDGKIMHAEIKIGNSRFMVNDVMPGFKGPQALGGSPASFWLYVDDADGLFKRAVGAGATVQMPIDNQFWGDRAGAVGDPAGYSWWIASRTEDLTHDEIQARAADFFKQMAGA
ncbi:MAG TPA: VOC family protein [Vicinamibacterales bacterium]|jgi:PhnB protein